MAVPGAKLVLPREHTPRLCCVQGVRELPELGEDADPLACFLTVLHERDSHLYCIDLEKGLQHFIRVTSEQLFSITEEKGKWLVPLVSIQRNQIHRHNGVSRDRQGSWSWEVFHQIL